MSMDAYPTATNETDEAMRHKQRALMGPFLRERGVFNDGSMDYPHRQQLKRIFISAPC